MFLFLLLSLFFSKQPEKCIEIIEDNITQKNDLRVELYMVVLRHLVPTGNVECVQKSMWFSHLSESL